jgi:hypothetical protein
MNDNERVETSPLYPSDLQKQLRNEGRRNAEQDGLL